MRQRLSDQEALLEFGMVLLGAVLLGALWILIFSRVLGGTRRGMRRREGPPSPGSIPPDRHRNISAVAPR